MRMGACWFLPFISEWEKSFNDQGFANTFNYMKHLREQDPAMCRIIYKSYNEVNCVYLRNF